MSLKREFLKISGLMGTLFFNKGHFKNTENPLISANIICHNNIDVIEACLKSLSDVVDEIVVVDGGSDDGTLEILEKYNCKVIVNKDWQGYSHQRNLALENSKGDWILKMDSDEILSCELRDNLRKLCSSKVYGGYKIFSRWLQDMPKQDEELSYIAESKYPGRYYQILRLFRNMPGIEWRKEVHEYIAGLEVTYKKTFSPNENYIYHLDVAINSLESRLQKVKERNEKYPGSGHPEEYLPELFDIKDNKVPGRDKNLIKKLLQI